jgi:hypothetical protein
MKKTMKVIGWISMSMITVGALFKIQHWPGAGLLLVFGFLFLGAIFFPSSLWVMKKESKLKGSLFIYLISMLGGIVLIFGILFKVQHYPGAGILLTIGFLSIALLLIPAILISKLRDEGARNLHVTYIIGAISLILYIVGDLCKIQHWPGAGILLVVGAISLTTIFLPIYTMKVYKNAESIKAGFLFLCVGILFFNMFNLLLALNVSKDIMSYFIKPGKEIIKTATILENKSDALSEKIFADSLVSDTAIKANVKKVKALSDATCNFIEEIKTDLISRIDDISKDEAKAAVKNTALIMNKTDNQISTLFLCGDSPDGSTGKASEIKSKLTNLKTELLKICTGDKNSASLITQVLNTDAGILKEDGKPISWEMNNFYHTVMISSINKLSYYQRNVRIAELEALESIESGCMADISKSISKN